MFGNWPNDGSRSQKIDLKTGFFETLCSVSRFKVDWLVVSWDSFEARRTNATATRKTTCFIASRKSRIPPETQRSWWCRHVAGSSTSTGCSCCFFNQKLFLLAGYPRFESSLMENILPPTHFIPSFVNWSGRYFDRPAVCSSEYMFAYI